MHVRRDGELSEVVSVEQPFKWCRRPARAHISTSVQAHFILHISSIFGIPNLITRIVSFITPIYEPMNPPGLESLDYLSLSVVSSIIYHVFIFYKNMERSVVDKK